jgi:DNA-binding NarL/FixJ family response regulator
MTSVITYQGLPGADSPRAARIVRVPVIETNDTLTRRDQQVLCCIAHACANKEIGWRLGLTEGTIKEYVHKLFLKLRRYGAGAPSNRVWLAMWARDKGLVNGSCPYGHEQQGPCQYQPDSILIQPLVDAAKTE